MTVAELNYHVVVITISHRILFIEFIRISVPQTASTSILSLLQYHQPTAVIGHVFIKQVAQLSQRDRVAVWVSCRPNFNIVFRIQRTLL